jgi:hypothetical protein
MSANPFAGFSITGKVWILSSDGGSLREYYPLIIVTFITAPKCAWRVQLQPQISLFLEDY